MAQKTLIFSPVVGSVTFKLDGRRIPDARSVALVGSFNRWDTSVHPLSLQQDGWWRVTLTLGLGEYPYLFVVDGVAWNDPEDDGRVPCEWGGEYSVRLVSKHPGVVIQQMPETTPRLTRGSEGPMDSSDVSDVHRSILIAREPNAVLVRP